jgi:hypothetical protein
MKIITLLTLSLCIENTFLLTLESVLPNLSALERYIKEYKNEKKNSSSHHLLVSSYIRSEKYKGNIWDNVCGSIPKDLDEYILKKDKEKGTKAHLCKTYGEIILPSKEKIDFTHLFAAMNGIEYGLDNKKIFKLAGWGIDCIELANDIKNINGNLNNLIIEATKFIGIKGKFSESHLISDLDAYTISWRKANFVYSKEFKDYYYGDVWKNRVTKFVRIILSNPNKDNLRELIYQKFINDSWIQMNIKLKGLSGHNDHIKAAVYAFADYLKKRL